MDFTVPAEHQVNMEENETSEKYLDLARKLKRLWNMKAMVIPIEIGALGTIPKSLVRGLRS